MIQKIPLIGDWALNGPAPIGLLALHANADKASYSDSESPAMAEDIHCSFCGKHQSEVLQIIAGPNVFVCDECVQLCVRMVITSRPEWRERLDLTPIQSGERESAPPVMADDSQLEIVYEIHRTWDRGDGPSSRGWHVLAKRTDGSDVPIADFVSLRDAEEWVHWKMGIKTDGQ